MKKFFSVFLSLIIISLSVLPCFATDGKCTCGDTPVIYVAALGSGSIYLDAGTENEKKLFRPETDALLSDFSPLIPAAAELILNKDYNAFGDVLINCVNSTFGMLALDGNGDSSERVTSPTAHPDPKTPHGVKYSYYFGYDFRLDPVENAHKLHTFIEEVKELTGHDTVRFRASSMGGVVTTSYIKLYGTDDIEAIIFQCCPLQGTAVAGELYNGKVEINKDALLNYATCALPDLENDALAGVLYTLIEMLDAGGVWLGLVDIADVLIENLKDRVFDESLIPIFGTMPGIWSFVPDEYYESAKDFMKLDSETHAGLLKKIDFYHYDVQKETETLLKKAQENGTKIYIVAGYNMQRTPLVTAHKNNSDGTVDTQYATVGATCAYIGETLPDGYTQTRFPETKYISPDRVIDASTCALPECTWFIKDMLHSSTHSAHHEFYRTLFNSDVQLTVNDMSEYPQFIQNDVNSQSFSPVKPTLGNDVLDALSNVADRTSFLNIMKLLSAFFEAFWSFMMTPQK